MKSIPPIFVICATAGMRLPSAHDVDQRGRGCEIRIEHIVARRLEVPLVSAGGGVEREDRRGVEVVARTVAAVEAAAGIAGRNEHHAALGVDGHESPDGGTAAILPAARPRCRRSFRRAAARLETATPACRSSRRRPADRPEDRQRSSHPRSRRGSRGSCRSPAVTRSRSRCRRSLRHRRVRPPPPGHHVRPAHRARLPEVDRRRRDEAHADRHRRSRCHHRDGADAGWPGCTSATPLLPKLSIGLPVFGSSAHSLSPAP